MGRHKIKYNNSNIDRRKITITLSEEQLEFIDNTTNNRSAYIRDAIELKRKEMKNGK